MALENVDVRRSSRWVAGFGRADLCRAVLLAAIVGAVTPAAAKDARCYTSDEGSYRCDFEQFGGDGSFIVSAPLTPSYTISIVRRGMADGFADFGNGNVALPGPFFRSNEDRACWIAEPTGFTICVY